MVPVPRWMASNARAGIDRAAAGNGPAVDGGTMRMAVQLASGRLTPRGVRRVAEWHARHATGADAVAVALNGGGLDGDGSRAREWAEAKMMEGDRSVHLTEAPGTIEVRADAGNRPVIAGYAAMFDTPTTINQSFGAYREVVARGAFKKTLKEADVRALYNHNPDHVLGRTRSGTLRLAEDEVGLRYEVDVPDTTWGRDLVELVRRGDVNQSSFAFAPVVQDWTRADAGDPDTRTLREVRLYDVSVVTYPAYEETVAQLRSDADRGARALGRLSRGQPLEGDDLEELARLKAIIDDQLEGAPAGGHAPGGPAECHPVDALRRRLRLVEALARS